MATSLYQFLPQVLPEVQGCPDIMALEAIRNAAIDLCERGSVLEVTLDPMDVIATQNQYDITPDDGLYPYHVKDVTISGIALTPKTVPQLDQLLFSWRTTTGTPQFFFRPDDLTLQLVLKPSVTYSAAMYVTLNVAPTRSCSTLDDKLYQRHYTTIAMGAKGALMAIPKQSWTNLDEAKRYTSMFEDKVLSALASNLVGQNNVSLRARAPRKFA